MELYLAPYGQWQEVTEICPTPATLLCIASVLFIRVVEGPCTRESSGLRINGSFCE